MDKLKQPCVAVIFFSLSFFSERYLNEEEETVAFDDFCSYSISYLVFVKTILLFSIHLGMLYIFCF